MLTPSINKSISKLVNIPLWNICKNTVLNILSKQNTTHIAEQYVYALMGELYYNLQDIKNAKKYLLKRRKIIYFLIIKNLYVLDVNVS